MDWPVGRGLGERSIMVMVGRRFEGRRVSQYARQGPAIPAPDMRMRSAVGVGEIDITKIRCVYVLRNDEIPGLASCWECRESC